MLSAKTNELLWSYSGIFYNLENKTDFILWVIYCVI